MSRLLLRCAKLAPLLAAACHAGDPGPRLPNLVLIVADDLGYGALGAYGQAKVPTPHLDRMAREGLRFTQFYAGAPACAPSRIVLMSGRHTGHLARRKGESILERGRPSLARLLQKAGYATGMFGKWGLGDVGTWRSPRAQGFDEFLGYTGHREAHDYYPEFLWKDDGKLALEGNAGGRRGQYSHDVVVDAALDFVERHRDRSFFLYLPVTLPHAELTVPDEALRELRGRFPETPFAGDELYPPQPEPRAAYAAMVARLDRDVGRLLAKLSELGIEDRTLVLFTSDNGPPRDAGGSDPDFFGNAGPLRGYKFTLYEGGLRVPLIARWPGRVPPARTSDAVAAFEDLLPTACALAGVDPGIAVDGVSLLPTLTGEGGQTLPERRFWYWPGGTEGMLAVRRGPLKAVRPGGPATAVELYDLEADPGETRNLARERKPVVEELMRNAATAAAP